MNKDGDDYKITSNLPESGRASESKTLNIENKSNKSRQFSTFDRTNDLKGSRPIEARHNSMLVGKASPIN